MQYTYTNIQYLYGDNDENDHNLVVWQHTLGYNERQIAHKMLSAPSECLIFHAASQSHGLLTSW
jgi:hypothetical protein